MTHLPIKKFIRDAEYMAETARRGGVVSCSFAVAHLAHVEAMADEIDRIEHPEKCGLCGSTIDGDHWDSLCSDCVDDAAAHENIHAYEDDWEEVDNE